MKKLLEVQNLKKYYPKRTPILRRLKSYIKAVDDISFHIGENEIVGLVGESGSGKSTAARAAIRLIEPTAAEIVFAGHNLMALSSSQLRKIRTQVQMVFQDPLASLNPRKTILENVGESLLYHKKVETKKQQIEAVVSILQQVGISSSALNQYPHQFSGGQQQRISIGRALILKPQLLMCDEITSALDLSIQAQVLNLIFDLKNTLHLSFLMISHDLAVIQHLCDRVLVMYGGKIVEESETEALFSNPQHPYTQKLLRACLQSQRQP